MRYPGQPLLVLQTQAGGPPCAGRGHGSQSTNSSQARSSPGIPGPSLLSVSIPIDLTPSLSASLLHTPLKERPWQRSHHSLHCKFISILLLSYKLLVPSLTESGLSPQAELEKLVPLPGSHGTSPSRQSVWPRPAWHAASQSNPRRCGSCPRC